MWLENNAGNGWISPAMFVSILLLLDVAGKQCVGDRHERCDDHVSILLLLDVAGKRWKTFVSVPFQQVVQQFQSFFFWMWLENEEVCRPRKTLLRSFNPSSSGCGWKTCV